MLMGFKRLIDVSEFIRFINLIESFPDIELKLNNKSFAEDKVLEFDLDLILPTIKIRWYIEHSPSSNPEHNTAPKHFSQPIETRNFNLLIDNRDLNNEIIRRDTSISKTLLGEALHSFGHPILEKGFVNPEENTPMELRWESIYKASYGWKLYEYWTTLTFETTKLEI